MPLLPGALPAGTFVLGLSQQNYNMFMGASGIFCAFIIALIWSRGF